MAQPESGHARSSQPSYLLIWAILVVALLVSMGIGELQLPVVTAVFIFSIALVKAYLVLAYYMHLRWEPYFVVALVATGMACLYVLFFGLVPDIVYGTVP